MQELMIDFIVSLDGYASAEGWPGYWGLEGPEYLAWLDQQPDHTVLMGATTYRLMSEMASEYADDPSFQRMADTPKVVFSRSLEPPLTWANSELVSDETLDVVRDLKETGTSPLRTLGSVSLCRSLLTAGLVDRYRLVVFPVITGETGRERIYDGYPDVALDMVASRTFDGRLQLLEYRPTILTGPPGTERTDA